jgi:vanillate O-demethylase monooxygenase subunit
VSAARDPGGSFVRNLWYVAAWSHELGAAAPIQRVMLGEPVALYRRSDGSVVALEDRCPHRFAPLSLGRIEGDDLRCGYHGLRFGADGACKEMPARAAPPRIGVRTFPAVERWSWIWVWMGDPQRADASRVPEAFGVDDPRWVMRASAMDYEANWELLNDNLCDLSHLDFSHATTLGAASGVKWSPALPRIAEIDGGLRIERWFPDAPIAPGRPERADTFNRYRYLLPGLFLMTTEWYPLGAAARCDFGEPREGPLSQRVEQQAVTPISETRSRYLYATGFAAGVAKPALVEGMFAVINAAFEEDRRILEGQQQILALTPPGRRMASSPHDAAPIAFRQLVEKRRAEERGEGAR